jgi:Transposase DNA-binding/Transposase Tn5 dimerisation domain
MESFVMETAQWAATQFEECDLGDKRRTRRLVKMAAVMGQNPAAGFPRQLENWSDVKAAYRLFDADDVTFEAVVTPHWRRTRAVGPGRFLVICDTSEFDFGIHREIEGLGPTGNGGGHGFLLHSALVVGAGSEEIVGLAGQKVFYRQPAPKKENTTQRLARDRESQVWGEVIDLVGPSPQGTQWVHVLDRGGDNFEVYCHCRQQQSDWVVRVAQLNRSIQTPAGTSQPVKDYLRTLPVAGTYQLKLRARKQQKARTATLEVRFGRLSMPEPKQKSPYVKSLQPGPIAMAVVWVREVDPPQGVEPIEWVLYTSLPVESFDDAQVIIGYYEQRWLIEEWHKAVKTGCRVEERQLKTAHRLEAMLGVMCVTAVRLLQLKAVARTDPERPARNVVPNVWIDMLFTLKKFPGVSKDNLTVRQFYRGLARLGGFLARKHDGEPGWITIWRGWETLNTMIRGYEIGRELIAR